MRKNRFHIVQKIYSQKSNSLETYMEKNNNKNKCSFRDGEYVKEDATVARSHTVGTFNGAASNRVLAKSAGLIYKGFGLQAATLPFPRRDPPTTESQCTTGERFRSPMPPFNFRATFQFLPADARPFVPFNSAERPSSLGPRDTYRRCQIPLFSIR